MERTDIEVASRRVDMGSCLRPPSYPRGSFSVISTPHQRGVWGSLGPAFASEFLTDQNTVRPTICPYTLRWISVPPELTLGRAWYTFKPVPPQPNCPSTDVHTKKSMLETQLPEGGVSRTNQRILANTHRILPPTLHTNNQASTADCSKTLRGLHFPMEVSGLFTRTAGSLRSS